MGRAVLGTAAEAFGMAAEAFGMARGARRLRRFSVVLVSAGAAAVSAQAPAEATQYVDTASATVYVTPAADTLWEAVSVDAGAPVPVEIAASSDGVSFEPLEPREAIEGGRRVFRFEPVAARMFRLRFPENAVLPEVRLHPAREVTIRVSEIEIEAWEDRAVVRWTTNVPDESKLYYAPVGWSRDRLRLAGGESFEKTKRHAVALPGLLPGTDYQVYIRAGEESVGAEGGGPIVFRTEGVPLPHATRVDVEAGVETAVFRFATNVPSVTRVVLEGPNGETRAREGPRGTTHEIRFDGLSSRTKYRYRFLHTDDQGRILEEPPSDFRTAGENLARGAPVRGTFNALLLPDQAQGETPPIRRATDGRDDYFTGMATSGDPADTPQWIEVDLGEPRALATIEVVWRGNAFPLQFFVMTANDPPEAAVRDWTYPTLALSAADGSFERSSRGDPLYRVVVPMQGFPPARYIQVFVPRNAPIWTKSSSWRFVQLAEVEAYPRRPAP